MSFLPSKFVYFIVLLITGVAVLAIASPLNATDMLTREQIVEIVRRQADAWENSNVEAISSDFAEDAVFVVPGMEFNGKAEITAAAEKYFQQFRDTQIEIKNIIIEGNKGAVEWDWRDRPNQAENFSYAEDAIIFELEGDKIVYWREYIEKQPPSDK